MKRMIDILTSGIAVLALSPVIALVAFAVWAEDRHSPLYIATRCGRNGKPFKMLKFRTMVVNAESIGGSSTGSNDPRITRVGRPIRRMKMDELPQLVNVLRGDMSLVGPRPNTLAAVAMYTDQELALLTVRPGITDLASVVFADEGEILADETDPDLAYERLIRPWKSRLGLFFVEKASVGNYLRIIGLTLLNSISRRRALSGAASLLQSQGADGRLTRIAQRTDPLTPTPPPG